MLANRDGVFTEIVGQSSITCIAGKNMFGVIDSVIWAVRPRLKEILDCLDGGGTLRVFFGVESLSNILLFEVSFDESSDITLKCSIIEPLIGRSHRKIQNTAENLDENTNVSNLGPSGSPSSQAERDPVALVDPAPDVDLDPLSNIEHGATDFPSPEPERATPPINEVESPRYENPNPPIDTSSSPVSPSVISRLRTGAGGLRREFLKPWNMASDALRQQLDQFLQDMSSLNHGLNF
jgi:hypothetical protein